MGGFFIKGVFMEKLVELFKNKKFMYIFSGFIALIGLIIILRPKGENPEKDDSEELKNIIKETNKTVKLIKKKNEELERNSHGKSIAQSNSTRKSKQITDTGNNEKGKGTPTGKQDDELDDSEDDDIDEPKQ